MRAIYLTLTSIFREKLFDFEGHSIKEGNLYVYEGYSKVR